MCSYQNGVYTSILVGTCIFYAPIKGIHLFTSCPYIRDPCGYVYVLTHALLMLQTMTRIYCTVHACSYLLKTLWKTCSTCTILYKSLALCIIIRFTQVLEEWEKTSAHNSCCQFTLQFIENNGLFSILSQVQGQNVGTKFNDCFSSALHSGF